MKVDGIQQQNLAISYRDRCRIYLLFDLFIINVTFIVICCMEERKMDWVNFLDLVTVLKFFRDFF